MWERLRGRHGDMNDRSSVNETGKEPLESYDEGPFGSGIADLLPAPLPAASEWFAGPLAVAGIGCLAGMAVQVSSALGLGSSAPFVTQVADKLAQMGGTPALLGIGGAALVGLAMGATARLRQTRRMLEAMGQTPDYGAWLEDLDEGLQRMHVSLVTVESHLAGSIRHVGDDLVARVEAALHSESGRGDHDAQELGARFMRLESALGAVSATVSRLEENQAKSAVGAGHDERVLDELGARIDQLVRSMQHEVDLSDSVGNDGRSEEQSVNEPRPRAIDGIATDVAAEVDELNETVGVERTDLERAATAALHANTTERSNGSSAITEAIDAPGPAMPTPVEALENDPCPVDGLSLFASVEGTGEVVRESDTNERSEASRRNPYDV